MRRFTCGAAALLASLTMVSATASAAPVTVGSPLTPGFEKSTFNAVATVANGALPEPGAHVTSPVTGVVTEWHMVDAQGGPFTLKVLRPLAGGTYTAVVASAPVTPTAPGLQTYATALPIQAGDLIALDNGVIGDLIGVKGELPGAEFFGWKPVLALGSTAPPFQKIPGTEIGFNAVVQPAPTVTKVTPATGSFKGGTKVKITGTDFTGASAVSFGGVPAKSFTVESETQISAVVAAAKKPGAAAIAVTTAAGTATAAGFKLTACAVPNLKNKKLEAAKKKLKKAGCKVGKVTKTNGVTTNTGKVTKQSKKAGKKLAPGTKVNVTLG